MPKYYAFYRVFFLCGHGCPEHYFDRRHLPEPGMQGEHVSLAYDLGELTDSQLESILSLVGQHHTIRISEDWNTDQKERGTLFLVRVSDSKCLGVMEGIEQKRKSDNLIKMQDRYKQAVDDSGFDKLALLPLAYCIKVIKDINKESQQTVPLEIVDVKMPIDIQVSELSERVLDQQKDIIKPLIVAVEKVELAVGKNTVETRTGFQSLKITTQLPLAELIKIIPQPPHEHWLTAQEVEDCTGEPMGNLNKQRQRGEQIEHDGLIYGRDNEQRVWCREKDGRVVYYLEATISGMSR